MRVHWFQHVAFEGLGSIEPWLLGRGHQLSVTRFQHWQSQGGSAELPDLDAIEGLIAMGGPMGVNDEDRYPWLVEEKRCIRAAIERGLPVLGICLGAQLIASALGARVFRNPEPEIGWFAVEGLGAPSSARFRFPRSLPVFHWHGETFDLPPGAEPLARSAACALQAFQLHGRVYGLQFHLEMTPEGARTLVEHCGDELIEAPFVQSASAILTAPPQAYRDAQVVLDQLLTALFPAS